MKKLSVFLLVFVVFAISSYAEQLRVTPEHPFYLDGEWVEASELEIGDVLKTYDGKKSSNQKHKESKNRGTSNCLQSGR